MLNAVKNAEALKNSIIINGHKDAEYIETLAQSQNLKSLREYGKVAEEIASMENPTREFKTTYVKLLMGFLAWDLCFNGRFDGSIEKWAMVACGIFPAEFESYKFMADDLANFAKAYVNYYANMAK